MKKPTKKFEVTTYIKVNICELIEAEDEEQARMLAGEVNYVPLNSNCKVLWEKEYSIEVGDVLERT